MKLSEMNEHQATAYRLMVEVYNDIVGGLENGLMDYEEGTEDYEVCKRALSDGNTLLGEIYVRTQQEATRRGSAKHIRFAGEEFLRERIQRRLAKDGYWN